MIKQNLSQIQNIFFGDLWTHKKIKKKKLGTCVIYTKSLNQLRIQSASPHKLATPSCTRKIAKIQFLQKLQLSFKFKWEFNLHYKKETFSPQIFIIHFFTALLSTTLQLSGLVSLFLKV